MLRIIIPIFYTGIIALLLAACSPGERNTGLVLPRSDTVVSGIAYVKESGFDRDIYLIQADGTGKELLIASDAVDSDPAFSPDGRTIAFRSRREGSSDLYLAAADGSGEWVNLINDRNDSFDDEFNPKWHPSGTLIALFTDRFLPPIGNCPRHLGIHHLAFIDLTLNPLRIEHFDDFAGEQETLAWSPDGKTMAFGSICTQQRVQIFSWNRETREIITITDGSFGSSNPAFSPDGKYLAFSATRDGPTDIMILELATGNLSNLTSSQSKDRHPSWSPDSQWIAFTSNETGNDDIFVINIDGSGRRNLTNSPGRDILPDWSPIE